MSNFDTSRWFKKQYLAEANITEEKLPYVNPDVFGAIYDVLKAEVPGFRDKYGTKSSFTFDMKEKLDMYGPGEEILGAAGLKEAPGSTLNLSKADMDKLHNDGEIEIDGHKISYKAEENLNEGRLAALKQKIKDAQDILDTGMADGVPLDNETEMLVQQELDQLKKQAAVEFLRTKR